MKKFILVLLLAIPLVSLSAQSQKFYTASGSELIFSSADVVNNGSQVNSTLRFTFFLHLQQQFHFDLTNNIGLYTGLGIRNVGFRMKDTPENLGYTNPTNPNEIITVQHRSYALGFPLALKLGSFDNNMFLYAGAEYEWMFHYKQKRFDDAGKSKYTSWTDPRVNSWIPSAFIGVQFPYGFNMKFKMYLKDFLNTDFSGNDFNQSVDYSTFEQSKMWYISIGWMINSKEVRKMAEGGGFQKAAAL